MQQLKDGGALMIYGYARCSTTEEKQDINRQIRELKAAGAEEVKYAEDLLYRRSGWGCWNFRQIGAVCLRFQLDRFPVHLPGGQPLYPDRICFFLCLLVDFVPFFLLFSGNIQKIPESVNVL